MNLCELKGHMWFVSERKEVKRLDGVFSVATKIKCARCRKEEYINDI